MNAEHDEWNHSDGWDLNLYHIGDKVTVSAYAVDNGQTNGSRWVRVAEGTVKPQDDALITAYKELAEQILGGK